MTAGDLDVRARVTGQDELAELGVALDQMAGSLATTLSELRAERDLQRRIPEALPAGVRVTHHAGRLVAEDRRRQDRVLAVHEVQVAVTEAGGRGPDQDLVSAREVDLDVGELEPAGCFPEDGGAHGGMIVVPVPARRLHHGRRRHDRDHTGEDAHGHQRPGRSDRRRPAARTDDSSLRAGGLR